MNDIIYLQRGLIPTIMGNQMVSIAGAGGLLKDEADGFSIDATSYDTVTPARYIGGPVGGTVACRDLTTLANRLNNVPLDSSNLTQSGTSPKVVAWNTFSGPHNILTQSEDLTFAADWGSQNATVTANQTTSPDGRATAEKFVATAGSAVHSIFRDVVTAFAANTVVTMSVYVKPNASEQYFEINPSNGSTEWFAAIFDIQAGTVVGNSHGVDGTYISASITNVGGGWWRCSVTGSSANDEGLGPNFAIVNSASPTYGNFGEVTWNPAGTETIFLWGAQLNIGSLTAYVPTTAVVSGGVRWTPQNIWLQSQTIDNAAWNKNNVTVTANSGTAPDGTLTADLITPSAGAANHAIGPLAVVTIVSGAVYTNSAYLKAGGATFAMLQLTGDSNVTNWVTVVVNLTTGLITETTNGAGGTLIDSSITPVGNGWYRVTVSGSFADTLSGGGIQPVATGTPAHGNYGDASDSPGAGATVLAWGLQLNRGPVATPYLVTTSAARIGIPQGYDVNASKFGMLIEPAATNILTRSEEFDNAAWTKTGGSITANVTGPDGGSTADLLVEDSSTGVHRFGRNFTGSAAVYTGSIYAKAGGRYKLDVNLYDQNSDTDFFAEFDLSAGSTIGVATGVTASILAIGNGWFRLSVTALMTGTSASSAFGPTMHNAANSNSYTGDSASGMYFYGAQIELGSVATSYVPTVSATATRAVDDVRAALSTTPHSATANSIYWDGRPINTVDTDFVSLSDGTNNERFIVNEESGHAALLVTDGGVAQTLPLEDGNLTLAVRNQISAAWAANDFDISCDGVAVASDPSGTMPTVTTMYLGAGNTGTVSGIMFIYRLVYVPRQVETGTANLLSWRYNYP